MGAALAGYQHDGDGVGSNSSQGSLVMGSVQSCEVLMPGRLNEQRLERQVGGVDKGDVVEELPMWK